MSLTPGTRVTTHAREWLGARLSVPFLRGVVTFAAGMFGGGAVVAWLLRDEKEKP